MPRNDPNLCFRPPATLEAANQGIKDQFEEVEECLWTDRGLVIIMIAVEMVMGEGVVVTAMGLKACLGWFLLLSTSFMPLPL